jgi:hypothetical protein
MEVHLNSVGGKSFIDYCHEQLCERWCYGNAAVVLWYLRIAFALIQWGHFGGTPVRWW